MDIQCELYQFSSLVILHEITNENYKMKQNLFASEKTTVNKPNCSHYSLQYFCMAVVILCILQKKLEQH